MKIPLVDLTTHNKLQRKKISQKIQKLIAKGQFILGDEVTNFEKKFASYIGTKYCISVASGTDALILSLKAFGIGKDDEVIIPSMTFIATALAVLHSQATPVFVDITPDTNLIDYTKIEKAITKRTKAIIPVHLYGNVCHMNEITKIANKHNLIIIEDACQAHGSMYKDKHAGSMGDSAAFSFYPSKNLGAYGDAGAITTSNKKIAQTLLLLRNYGAKEKYIHTLVGYNSRLDNLQAGVLSIKLETLDKQNDKRREHVALYSQQLKKLPIDFSIVSQNVMSNYHLYTIRVKKRDELLLFLKNKNIFCGIHYPLPLHLQPAFAFLQYKKGDFPNSEKLSLETLSLPLYPEMTKKEILYICRQISTFFQKTNNENK